MAETAMKIATFIGCWLVMGYVLQLLGERLLP
jgi:hypothetical protein